MTQDLRLRLNIDLKLKLYTPAVQIVCGSHWSSKSLPYLIITEIKTYCFRQCYSKNMIGRFQLFRQQPLDSIKVFFPRVSVEAQQRVALDLLTGHSEECVCQTGKSSHAIHLAPSLLMNTQFGCFWQSTQKTGRSK